MRKYVTPCECKRCGTRESAESDLLPNVHWVALDEFGSALTTYVDPEGTLIPKLNVFAKNTHILTDENGSVMCASCFDAAMETLKLEEGMLQKWL